VNLDMRLQLQQTVFLEETKSRSMFNLIIQREPSNKALFFN